MDGLIKVRELHDSSLAFRRGCLHCNTCKMCLALIDGRAGYLCTSRLEEKVTVEPLKNRRIIRDLVVEME